jgi:BirA family transcriptional regulator, biotin operon repressor / biotin---[acetyl-CoA-carboxylase] ligase
MHTLDLDALTCVSALEQTAGIGRYERPWLSPKGLNIHATLCFTLPEHCPCIANLGQLLSLSAAAFLEKQGFSPEIKWPNDIRVQGRKIAGILCETFPMHNRIGIILSIGFNVNMSDELLGTISQPATSLLQLSGHEWNISEVLDLLLQQFVLDIDLLYTQGFPAFRDKYEELLAFKKQTIRCFDGRKTIEGICQGVLADGRLELLMPSGEKMHLSAGELQTPLTDQEIP